MFVILLISLLNAERIYNMIPSPVKLEPHEENFTFNAETTIILPKLDNSVLTEELQLAANALSEIFSKPAGFQLKIVQLIKPDPTDATNIVIFKISTAIINKEGYQLNINPKYIEIVASTPTGLFYGTQTIRQLLPPEAELQQKDESGINWTVPCAEIEDYPQYSYRGLMIDVSRHFTNASMIMRYIELLSLFKLNVLHWHLTDDQGWRIEIKSYPKLSEFSAWRKDSKRINTNNQKNEEIKQLEEGIEFNWGEDDDQTEEEDIEVIDSPHSSNQRPHNTIHFRNIHMNDQKDGLYGGFYTQEEIREVVEFARRRFVTIIPEIEMPGHAVAVFAAYPQLSCRGADEKVHFDVATSWGIFSDVFCLREETFQFLESVLTEVANLFPYSELIHIGGDECPKSRWTSCSYCKKRAEEEGIQTNGLQTYLVNRISKFVHEKLGRRVIGWDEIMDTGLDQEAAVMSWRGTSGGLSAARKGHDAVFTPQSHCYFDHYQARQKDEPRAIGGFLPLETVYQFDPLQLTGLRKDTLSQQERETRQHILGGQGNLWTEYMPNIQHTDYMLFPRTCALAETLWSPYENKNYDDFRTRLNPIVKKLDVMEVNYCKASLKTESIPIPEKNENQNQKDYLFNHV